MAISMDQVHRVLEQAELKYHAMDDTHVLLGFRSGERRLGVVLNLQEDGEYLTLRTFRMASCPKTHPNRQRIHEELSRQNARLRMVRLGWDEEDGEITGEVSLPLEDNTSLPVSQVQGLVACMFIILDEVLPAVEPLIEQKAGSKPADRPSPARSPTRTKPALKAERVTGASVPRGKPRAPVRTTAPSTKRDLSSLLYPWGLVLVGLIGVLAIIYLIVRG
jgi:hypothetical protein